MTLRAKAAAAAAVSGLAAAMILVGPASSALAGPGKGWPKCMKVVDKSGNSSWSRIEASSSCKHTGRLNVELQGLDGGWVSVSPGEKRVALCSGWPKCSGAYGVKMYYRGEKYSWDF
ncbi:hypothetical protein [Allokutzneria sp. NRRL B-24872]|uniref:hypothetical protein n=1 Tax=Allokutzneria sp. NRRL B-24872 TaxID=1137961 RepID=UPI001177D44C|nr:hypothetical protein [Allokutzneria sp. NRRL B-24872]